MTPNGNWISNLNIIWPLHCLVMFSLEQKPSPIEFDNDFVFQIYDVKSLFSE